MSSHNIFDMQERESTDSYSPSFPLLSGGEIPRKASSIKKERVDPLFLKKFASPRAFRLYHDHNSDDKNILNVKKF